MIYNHHFKATYTVEVTSCFLFFWGVGGAKARPGQWYHYQYQSLLLIGVLNLK